MPPAYPGWQDRYPFQLGFAVLAYSALALWGWVVITRRTLAPLQVRLLGFAFGGGLLLVALSLAWSAPLWQLSGADRLLTYPWQILLLAAPLLAAAAGSLPVLLPDLAQACLAPPIGPCWWLSLCWRATRTWRPPTRPCSRPPSPLAMLGTNQLAILAADVTEGGRQRHARRHLAGAAAAGERRQRLLPGNCRRRRRANGSVAQLDTQPAGPDRPATTWQPGEILTQRYTLDMAQAPPGEPLRYYFGFYDWSNGERLPVDGGIDDKLVLYAQ